MDYGCGGKYPKFVTVSALNVTKMFIESITVSFPSYNNPLHTERISFLCFDDDS